MYRLRHTRTLASHITVLESSILPSLKETGSSAPQVSACTNLSTNMSHLMQELLAVGPFSTGLSSLWTALCGKLYVKEMTSAQTMMKESLKSKIVK